MCNVKFRACSGVVYDVKVVVGLLVFVCDVKLVVGLGVIVCDVKLVVVSGVVCI